MATVTLRYNPRATTTDQAVAPTNTWMRQFIWFGAYDDYEFPYAPKIVQLDDMAADIAEIPRPRAYPYISQRGLKLTRIQFTFTVADRASGGLLPVDNELRRLRAMALRDTNVTFHGFDRLMQYQIPTGWFDSSLVVSWWKITSFSVSVKQRTGGRSITDPARESGIVGNRISVAECTMSFVEWRNPNVPFWWLPQITYPVEFPGGGGGSNSDGIFRVGQSGNTYDQLQRPGP